MAGITTKIKEWLWRYGPAEVISLATTLGASWIALSVTGSKTWTAFAGTWGGNIGYFGTILLSDIIQTRKRLTSEGKRFTIRILLKILRALFIEFGIAEVFDSLLIRPALLYWMPVWLQHMTWGLILGKFAADLTFYIPAIISYELSRRKFRNF